MTGANISQFEVLPWEIENNRVVLRYHSSAGDFAEIVEFPVDIELSDQRRRLIDILALVSAVSYAKVLAPTHIHAPHFELTQETVLMLEALYDHGMREFAFHNSLPLANTFTMGNHLSRSTTHMPGCSIDNQSSLLIPLGAGRDSSVVASALQKMNPTLLSIGDNTYARQIAEQLSLSLHTVTRTIDPFLLDLNSHGALNGHIPVTAINSVISLVYASLTQCDGVVMANESSSSEPTRQVESIEINHQYSKSLHFETLLRSTLSSNGIDTQYFSALRDKEDSNIARVFAQHCSSLHKAFMSCNQAMLRDASRRSDGWCGQCPKCRSVFLSLAPHLTPAQLTDIFGRNLLDDPDQLDGFRELLDIARKPFECVGEVATAVEAFQILRTSPAWAGNYVVDTLAPPSLPAQRHDTTSVHFIPQYIHQQFDTFFHL